MTRPRLTVVPAPASIDLDAPAPDPERDMSQRIDELLEDLSRPGAAAIRKAESVAAQRKDMRAIDELVQVLIAAAWSGERNDPEVARALVAEALVIARGIREVASARLERNAGAMTPAREPGESSHRT